MRRRWRLGLRTRTTAAFALSGLLLSLALSALTYQLARQSFTRQRREAAVSRALQRARSAQASLQVLGVDPVDVVDQLKPGANESFVIEVDGTPFASGPEDDRVPKGVRRLVGQGQAARQLFRDKKGPGLAMGFPLSRDGKAYYEVASLAELERSLRDLGRVLALAATATTVAGAVLGRISSRGVMRPLRQAAAAASEIASGRLDTRIDAARDPDLAPLATSFNDMAASLQRRIEREARFASDVSHELRTPLTALAAATQILQSRREEMSERSQTALDVLVNQSGHFQRLVLDLLEISRFDAGAAELHRENQDIVDLVEQIVAASSTPDVPVDGHALTHRVLGVDKRRLERIITNLVQNAHLYGGGAVRVGLEDLPGPSGVRRLQVVVDDSGPGIPIDERQTVFERFTRGTANSGRSGSGPKGTGLGLSLVSEHARLHGGSVHIEDRPGGGARFVVELEAVIP